MYEYKNLTVPSWIEDAVDFSVGNLGFSPSIFLKNLTYMHITNNRRPQIPAMDIPATAPVARPAYIQKWI